MANSKNYKKALIFILTAFTILATLELSKQIAKFNYEWFHCTAVEEPVKGSKSVNRVYAVGGPSCDKRGEFKSILNKISKNYDPNLQSYSFCMIENHTIESVHYPIGNNKGPAGYIGYVGYNDDAEIVSRFCKQHSATIFNF